MEVWTGLGTAGPVRAGGRSYGLTGSRIVCAMSTPTRPVIGMCTALEQARWSVWDQQAALLPYNYVEAVQRAGGLGLLLPGTRS